MGGFGLGAVIGWGPTAARIYTNMTEKELGHVSATMCLGAMTAQLVVAFALPAIGPKVLMIILAPIFTAFWILMGCFTSFAALLVGRFFTGLCGGAFCVIAPTYIGEIADKWTRGTLSLMFQLFILAGMLMQAALAFTGDPKWCSFVPAIAPIILLLIIIFIPTSPAFLITKEKEEKAKKALTFFRGKEYDISGDYKELEDYVNEGKGNFKENMKKKASKKAFVMLLVLHIVQQLGGIFAVTSESEWIFELTTQQIMIGASKLSNLTLCAVQLAACIITTFIVDRLGRKILWYISLMSIAICLIMLSVYFFIIELVDEDLIRSSTLGLFPLFCIYVYVFGFCFASGPLPWAMIGEYLPAGVKNVAGPIITAVNWILAYCVMFWCSPLGRLIGYGPIFLVCAIVNVLGFVFVRFFLIEAKNKSLHQIQEELGK